MLRFRMDLTTLLAAGALLGLVPAGGCDRAGDATTSALDDHAVGLESEAPDSLTHPGPALVLESNADVPPELTPLPPGLVEQELTIGRDQSFYEALLARGAGHTEIMALVEACRPFRNLRSVRRGDVFRIVQEPDGTVRRLGFDLGDGESHLAFERQGEDRFRVFELAYPVEHRLCAVSGEVAVSLYESLKACGAPQSLAAKMNDILGWDIDFRRDVREGDRFRIIFEEILRDGEFVRTGPILALEYENRGRRHNGYLFSGEDGAPHYYDAAGQSLEKQLMRAPLQYSRISSGFTHRRLHPVHKKYAPHLGVDYAAPVGTPVRAAGAGEVIAAAYNRHNGRYIRIRHANRSYETYYLHLSRYAGGLKKGTRVSQGQVIGYVGATGTASGPHLDYRVKKDGVFVDPRRLKLPASKPVPDAERDSFVATVAAFGYALAALPPGTETQRIALRHLLSPPYSTAQGPLAPRPELLAGGGVSVAASPAR